MKSGIKLLARKQNKMNLLEKTKDDFMICDDKTGKLVDIYHRFEPAETLKLIGEAWQFLNDAQPKIEEFEKHFALNSYCKHLGWTAIELVAIEKYAGVIDSFATSKTGSL